MNMNSSPPKKSWLLPSILISILGLCFICILCVVTLVAVSVNLFQKNSVNIGFPDIDGIFEAAPSPEVLRPTAQTSDQLYATPSAGSNLADSPPESEGNLLQVPTESLQTLTEADVPINDPLKLAQLLEGKGEIPEIISTTYQPLLIGSEATFWATNSDTNENFQVPATLRYVTDHSYFWIENGVPYDEGDVKLLAETFENKIYPTNRAFFGSEWTPGVDGDPHLYILYARNLGRNIAGYYSSRDEYHPMASEYSNGHEMFFFSADTTRMDEEFTYAVLAHEFQHMIHWYIDRNEVSWITEGFSELAAFLNGYGVGFHDYAYIQDTDIQLTDWPVEERGPHYGAAFLFLNYFLNRFGEQVTKELVASPIDGMNSVNQVLKDNGVTDTATGMSVNADDVFADWVLASYLKDPSIGDGRYTYANYSLAPQASDTETLSHCDNQFQTRDVSQFGVDYIRITCPGEYRLHFEGSTLTKILPAEAHSGSYYFWSNRGDEADITLTQAFDFSDQPGPLSLSYWTWYDLEKDYDYVYVEASRDGGETWDFLITPSGTAEDPSGNSYGWGYNGPSGDAGGNGYKNARWIEETIDLSAYAGQEVLLRFEYITDAAVNGEGFLLDDISIPQVGYSSDFETDDGGWQADGFVRISNLLPQTYRVSIIRKGEEVTVDKYTLSGENVFDTSLQVGKSVDEVILVVSGTTPYTRLKTAYRFKLGE